MGGIWIGKYNMRGITDSLIANALLAVPGILPHGYFLEKKEINMEIPCSNLLSEGMEQVPKHLWLDKQASSCCSPG